MILYSFAPCCPCINDMGDIVLFGSDASEKKKDRKTGVKVASDPQEEKWVLKRISNSFAPGLAAVSSTPRSVSFPC